LRVENLSLPETDFRLFHWSLGARRPGQMPG